jgi:MFS family permease
VLLGLTILYGVPIVAVALSRTLWVTLPMLFLAGVLGAAFMSGNNAMIQHRVSDDVRGRVMGAYMLTWGFMPLGSLPMGILADRIGITAAVGAGAIVSSVLAALYGLRSPALREL